MSLANQFNELSTPRKVLLKSKLGFVFTISFPVIFFSVPFYFFFKTPNTPKDILQTHMMIPFGMGVLAGIVFYFASYSYPKNILSKGTMVEGKILQVFSGKNRSVEVEYTPIDGPLQKRTFAFTSICKVGDQVNVVYDVGNPKKAVLYPVALLRIEALLYR